MPNNNNRRKLSYKEVEALLHILTTIEMNGDALNEIELSAKETLKRIYAAQISSHSASVTLSQKGQ